jgi:hypothetical protein
MKNKTLNKDFGSPMFIPDESAVRFIMMSKEEEVEMLHSPFQELRTFHKPL